MTEIAIQWNPIIKCITVTSVKSLYTVEPLNAETYRDHKAVS